jgi:hypothetical protein
MDPVRFDSHDANAGAARRHDAAQRRLADPQLGAVIESDPADVVGKRVCRDDAERGQQDGESFAVNHM